MTRPDTALHIVVFCVRPESLSATLGLWADLGMEFESDDMPEAGLAVHRDIERGIEIICPKADAGDEATPFREFLDRRGEGVYAVILKTADLADSVAVSERNGLTVKFAQRVGGDRPFEEAMMHPFHGMALSFTAYRGW